MLDQQDVPQAGVSLIAVLGGGKKGAIRRGAVARDGGEDEKGSLSGARPALRNVLLAGRDARRTDTPKGRASRERDDVEWPNDRDSLRGHR